MMISDARYSVRLAALMRKIKSEDASVGGMRRRVTLYSLMIDGDLTTAELNERFGNVHETTASNLIRNLVAEGLVDGYRIPPSMHKNWTLTEYGMRVALDLLDKEDE